MPKKEDNALAGMVATLQTMWRHRRGNEIPGAILDTFDNLGYVTKDNRKPVLVAKRKTDYGWHLVFHLPPGIAFSEVRKHREYFENATNSWIDLKWMGGKLQMNIQSGTLPTSLPYSWAQDEYRDLCLPIPIGMAQQGLEVLDLAESPHLLIAGVPGFGKSNFLHVLIHSLLDRALIGIVDMKRLEFHYLRKYCALARNEGEALGLMLALNKEMERRIDILEKAGCVKVQDYKGEDMPFIVLVIDELAELGDETVLYYLDRLVRLARAVGISVVAATQRPSTKVINGDTRAMFQARLCFQVADELNSRMVLGETCNLAAWLPGIKGRAIYKFGLAEKEVQTMFLPLSRARRLLEAAKPRGWCYEMPDAKSKPTKAQKQPQPARKRLPPR
jgi:S-DNA-T family DNA segregation ATPase FtsK/SpoIIIE